MLGRTIGGVARQGKEARHGTHSHDVPATVLHVPHGFQRAVHGATEIHVHHLPVLVIGEVTCPAGVDHPRVVHQDVPRAELPFHVPEDRGPRFFVADVVFHTDGADVLG